MKSLETDALIPEQVEAAWIGQEAAVITPIRVGAHPRRPAAAGDPARLILWPSDAAWVGKAAVVSP